MTHIVTCEQLKQLQANDEVTIVDVRFHLQQPHLGKELYDKAHLSGAYFLDIDKDLSGEIEQHGGNHPLPNIDQLASKLGSIGIHLDRKVVIYDDIGGMFAARAWWLLNYIGHKQSMILEGGYQAWIDLGYRVTDEVSQADPVVFNAEITPDKVVTMEEVKKRDLKKSVLIDSRAFARYIGEEEPLYKKAGHIPGAKSYFWQDVLTDENKWKDETMLQEQFKALNDAEEIIVSCGSGISACPNIIALKRAGFRNVKLYPGSFSDWISYDENDVTKGVE